MFIQRLRKLATSQMKSVRTVRRLRGSRRDRSLCHDGSSKNPPHVCVICFHGYTLWDAWCVICQGMIKAFKMSRDKSPIEKVFIFLLVKMF